MYIKGKNFSCSILFLNCHRLQFRRCLADSHGRDTPDMGIIPRRCYLDEKDVSMLSYPLDHNYFIKKNGLQNQLTFQVWLLNLVSKTFIHYPLWILGVNVCISCTPDINGYFCTYRHYKAGTCVTSMIITDIIRQAPV